MLSALIFLISAVLDEATNLFVGEVYSRQWLINHESLITLGFLQRYHPIERPEILKTMYENAPEFAMRAVKDWDIPDDEKIKKIQKLVATVSGEVWVTVGRKGSGKTATGYWLMELAHKAGRACYLSGPPQKTPRWVKRVTDPGSAPEGALVYVSEGAIQYSARTTMRGQQRDALSILPVLRHSKRLIIVETQSSRMIDVNFLRMMDVIILKQEPLFSKNERHPLMNVLEILKPKRPQETLFFGGSWFTLLQHQPLPKCWSDDLSLSYAPIANEEEALSYAQDLLDQEYDIGEVRRILTARSFNRPKWWWEEQISPPPVAPAPPSSPAPPKSGPAPPSEPPKSKKKIRGSADDGEIIVE